MMNVAKAHAWQFPGKRIQVGKRVFREAFERATDYVDHLDDMIKRHRDNLAHPGVKIALRLAIANADRLTPEHHARLSAHLGRIVKSEVTSDMKRSGLRWRARA
jgi:hypothetical protein